MSEQGNRLRLGGDRALYVGDLPATQWHRHAAPVLLIGLSGELEVRLPQGQTERCRSVLIDSDIEHLLDSRGERVAAIYLEPDAPEVRNLRAHVLRGQPAVFNVAAPAGEKAPMERRLADFDLAALLAVSFPHSHALSMDSRISRALPLLRGVQATPVVRGELARNVHLSESRFNHLFTAEMGICFRRYRSWALLRNALYQIARRHSFTEAALHAGLYDSAHFSRLFREMIGLTPSSVLKDLAAFETLD